MSDPSGQTEDKKLRPGEGGRVVLVCPCPDLAFDVGLLAEGLVRMGMEVRRLLALCTPEGLAELRRELAEGDFSGMIAACGREVNAGMFDLLAGGRSLKVVDILGAADLDSAWARLTTPDPSLRGHGVRRSWRREVLVLGGGVGGCQAALDLADAGLKVYLVDTSLSIGGTMAQLDKTFPTLDCSICILGPKLVEVAAHGNIELLAYAEVDRLRGRAGHFVVDLTLKPRYVDMSKCVGCGRCAEVCPVIVPSRWNLNLKPRRSIRIIFAQAVPLVSTIEKDSCLECELCLKACEHEAINLADAPASRRLEVGAIILATGARPFDPTIKGEYGYGRLPGVLTNLEFERLVCATGPTQGSLVTPGGRPVSRLAFIQCVGSRDRRFLPYCSGFCCTASIKEAMLALEHNPEAEITIFFNDIRTSGKGFEELYQRARQAGVRFIKGLPGRLEAGPEGQLVIFYEDQLRGGVGRLTVDLVVLAVGLEAGGSPLPWSDVKPAQDSQGFYLSRHPQLEPLSSTVPGVFVVGTCQAPKDVSETVTQASAAATQVLKMLATLEGDEL